MRGIKVPKNPSKAYTIASDALLLIAEHSREMPNSADKFRIQSLCYTAMADILDMADEEDPEQIQRDLQWESKEELRETIGDDVKIRIYSPTTSLNEAIRIPRVGMYESAHSTACSFDPDDYPVR